MSEPSKIEVVRKLLAKAEDPATSSAEREAILDKVTFLMAKHGIEDAMLKAKDKETPDILRRTTIGIQNPYAKQRMILLNVICLAFNCKVIKINENKCVVFGFSGDLERAYMLYGSLSIQLITSLSEAQKFKPNHEHGKSFNSSFVQGFIYSSGKKVMDAYHRAKKVVREESGSGMDLVLADRSKLIQAEVAKEFPMLVRTSVSTRSSSDVGYSFGKAAGTRADIGNSRISNNGGGRAIGH